jgi:glycosyltransferase involved in cell wall biosynthesis
MFSVRAILSGPAAVVEPMIEAVARMRLLLLDQFSDLGGAQQVLLEFLPAIRGLGWKALLGLPGEGEFFARARALDIPAEQIVCGPFASGRKSLGDIGRLVTQTPRLARQIRGLASRIRADLVYVNGPRLLPAAALAGLRCPVLFHAHSYLPPGPVRKLAGLSLERLGARVVGSCRFVADLWHGFAPSDRISVIYNGVAGQRETHHTAHPPRYSIGCIGRISPEKGQREFVAAAAAIHHALPGCRFVIYGAPLFSDDAARRYHEEVRAAAAGLPIEFAGWVNDVRPILADLDLLLVPSVGLEATPRVIMEAFTAGVPVISFPSGGIPELIDDGRTGFLVHSAPEMARLAIELLTEERARLAGVARAARLSWRRHFTLQRFQRQVLGVLQSARGVSGGNEAKLTRISPSECP